MKTEKNARNPAVEILIAEDSRTQAEQLRHLLEGQGYRVTVATNGKEALAAARRRKPDLVISDILMPEMDGYGLCSEIKSDRVLNEVPVVLLTSLSSPQDVINGLQCGADNFIRKPYDERYLISRVEYLLTNQDFRKGERIEVGLKIRFDGGEYLITSQRQQMLDLLISTYEEAVALNLKLTRSHRMLNGLYRIAEGLNEATSARSVCETALKRSLELPGVQAGWIFLREGETGFAVAAACGLPPALSGPHSLEGDCLCRQRLLSGELDHAVNILECERLKKNAGGDTAGLHYHASVPLCTGGRAMGLMNLAGFESTLFSDDDLKTLYGIGNQVATALARALVYETLEKKVEERTAALAAEVAERKRAHEEIQRNLGRLRALHEIDLAITSTLDLRSVLNMLLERTSLFFPYDAAVFAQLWDTEHGKLGRVACCNVDEKGWKDLQLAGGPSLQAFETQSPIVVRNIWRDSRVQEVDFYREHGLISYLGAPIIVKNKTLGVLSLCTKEQHEFSASEVDFLVTLASQAAIAIDNAQLYERTKQQAVELERANRSRSEFLSVVSHELRTPLTAVVGYTNLIEDGILGEVNEKQKKALATIGQRSQDLHVMINAILQATRIEAGAINVTTEEVPLTAFLDGLRSAHVPPPDKGLTVTWNYPAEMPTITTDSNKLKQILQNLLGNAFKFTEADGTVTVSARVLEETPRSCVEFEVRDDGIGIPTEELPKIFDMFRQVDSSDTRSYGGVGLGLYIAKAFTELLGGTIRVESEPGKGSAFSVRIPTPC